MNNKRVNFFICTIIIAILSIVIFLTKIDNNLIFLIIYMGLTIYFIFNFFNDEKIIYLRYIYILYVLISILFIIFSFNLISFIALIILTTVVIVQYYKNKNIKKKNIEIKNVVKKEIKKEVKKEIKKVTIKGDIASEKLESDIKKLYNDVQEYFMNLEYDKLKKILGDNLYQQFIKQMVQLEKYNKRAIRENIDIFDYKVNNVNKKDNLVIINASIGVVEDKYTKYLDKPNNIRKITYESYYDIEVMKENNRLKLENLKIIYSHSKKN